MAWGTDERARKWLAKLTSLVNENALKLRSIELRLEDRASATIRLQDQIETLNYRLDLLSDQLNMLANDLGFHPQPEYKVPFHWTKKEDK